MIRYKGSYPSLLPTACTHGTGSVHNGKTDRAHQVHIKHLIALAVSLMIMLLFVAPSASGADPGDVVVGDFTSGSLILAVNRITGGPLVLPYTSITSLSFKDGASGTLSNADFNFLKINTTNLASAFLACAALESVGSNEIKSVADQGFDGCASLKSVVLADDAVLGYQSFTLCSSLTSVGDNTIAQLGRSTIWTMCNLRTRATI